MPDEKSNIDLVRESIRATRNAVLPASKSTEGGASSDSGAPTAFDQSAGKTVQSVGLTTAIVIQDAADMLRNVSTVQVTAIGAATAAWITTRDPQYKAIIQDSIEVLNQAVATYLTIGRNAYEVLNQFK